ncbi:MAG: hypothetical protein GF349_00705 [Candidatus Magasanikbacteria bacterium]|nr:hypothetical protein [Candidatus Magasanikbacteria bacterium]
MNLFEKIVNTNNIINAYLDLVKTFDENSKSAKYRGLDGKCLNDFDFNSAEMVEEIETELKKFIPLTPALKLNIPKKSGGDRSIFIYSVKDRIKAQAIYRIIEPIVNNMLSDYLYSYRTSHPAHKAAKSVVKRYNKHYKNDFVFCADIKDYTDNINQNILKNKIKSLYFDEKTELLLNLFIKNKFFFDKSIIIPKKGLVQGVPIIAFFANLYLDDMDKEIGKKVSLYRRVGDDFILMDKNITKLNNLKTKICRQIENLDLHLSEKKTSIQKAEKKFIFLGYEFSDGTISINNKTTARAISRWKRKLDYKPIPTSKKLKKIKYYLYTDSDSIHHDFLQLLSSYRLVNNDKQIKKLSETFFKILTKYFFKKYSHKKQNQVKKILKSNNVPSLFKYYLNIKHGKKSITELSVSKKTNN